MEKTILVLHGMTMSGATVVRSLGPLASELEQAGYELLAPDGGHKLTEQELNEFLGWVAPLYEKRGRAMNRMFKHGAFWDEGSYYDWLSVETDEETGGKIYHALHRSLDELSKATEGRSVVGVVGFSQGAILATLLEALGAQGEQSFLKPKFGIYIAGSRPGVKKPVQVRYPIRSSLARLLMVGGKDPFFDGEESLHKWAAAFEGESELLFVPDVGHEVPTDPVSVARMMDFVRAHG